MKTFLTILVCASFLCTSKLYSQSSIGFSDSTDFKYLINYTLPDWGYSNFSIASGNIDLSGGFRFIDQEIGSPFFTSSESDLFSSTADIGISPQYELYRENEKRTISLITSTGFFFGLNKNTSDETFTGTERKTEQLGNNQSFIYDIDFEGNSYINDNLFVLSDLDANLEYLWRNSESKVNNETTNQGSFTVRLIDFRPTIGLGFGRIRNVTPTIRAIRLNERYKTLTSSSFSDDEIEATANTFTKVQGYQRTKDRFLKDFWSDINDNVNGSLDQLNTYDLFYLNDIFSENLGSRFEGYESSLSVDYIYFSRLTKDEDKFNNSESRNFTIFRQTHLNLNLDWFKNLDLSHQLGLNFENKLILPLERTDPEEWINQLSVNGQWLWNFADRFQVVTDFENTFSAIKTKRDTDEKFRTITSIARTNLFYFIENRIALNAGVLLGYGDRYRKFDVISVTDKQFIWRLNGGINYYFNRNLY
ncbi:MAG: hypothetical protein ABJK11_09635 [Balneola sp.]